MCGTGVKLRSQMRAYDGAYRRAIIALEGCVEQGESWTSFDRAVKNAEYLKRMVQASRARLERHVAEHRCDAGHWRPERLLRNDPSSCAPGQF
jgi:hypothetical protein